LTYSSLSLLLGSISNRGEAEGGTGAEYTAKQQQQQQQQLLLQAQQAAKAAKKAIKTIGTSVSLVVVLVYFF
jgi:hypothetical protein